MIYKSLLGFLVLSLFYTLAIVAFPGLSVSQNLSQTNYIKAEQYLYSDSADFPVTIVGTSLSANLVADSLPEFFNLAFAGMNASDGLAIVSHRNKKPEILLLEMNRYYKASSADFLEPLFNPVNYQLKKYLTAFRSDKQPVALATSGIIEAIKNLKNYNRVTKLPDAIEKAPFQQWMFETYLKEGYTLPDSLGIWRELARLKAQIVALEKQGVKVVFVEIPINAKLVNSPRQKYTRQQFRRAFPPDRYQYVPDKVWNFQTTDGIHFSKAEAQQYSGFLHAWYISQKNNEPVANLSRSY